MEAGQLVDGRFEIMSPVATYGIARVYSARDADDGSAVAIKTVEPRGGAHGEHGGEVLLREAELLASLRHPRFAQHVKHGTPPGGGPYLATRWLEGTELVDRKPPALGVREQV